VLKSILVTVLLTFGVAAFGQCDGFPHPESGQPAPCFPPPQPRHIDPLAIPSAQENQQYVDQQKEALKALQTAPAAYVPPATVNPPVPVPAPPPPSIAYVPTAPAPQSSAGYQTGQAIGNSLANLVAASRFKHQLKKYCREHSGQQWSYRSGVDGHVISQGWCQ
jgi:hypothetical protein